MKLKLRNEYGKFEDYILKRNRNIYKSQIFHDDKENNKMVLPTFDCVFKWMFAREYTKRNACLLLNTILKIDVEKLEKKMILIRNEMGPDHYGGKGIRMDFVGKADDVIFNIEMNQSNTLERNIDYTGKLYSSESKKGKEKYNQVFQLNINNFRIRGQNRPVEISMLRGKRGMRSKIIVVDVYLPIINEKYKSGVRLKRSEKTILWMFIGNEEEMKKLGGKNKDMKNYIKELKKYAEDEEAMREYREEYDSAVAGREMGIEIGLEKGLEKGREEGREEGIEIGEEKNKIETATIMLRDGIPKETVQKYTKLTFEKIANIMTLL